MSPTYQQKVKSDRKSSLRTLFVLAVAVCFFPVYLHLVWSTTVGMLSFVFTQALPFAFATLFVLWLLFGKMNISTVDAVRRTNRQKSWRKADYQNNRERVEVMDEHEYADDSADEDDEYHQTIAERVKKSISEWCGQELDTFRRNPDRYSSLEKVEYMLRRRGLECCNMLVAVDFTSSNMTQGMRSFDGKSLHHLNSCKDKMNPYEKVIEVMGKTLEKFDDDRQIAFMGFGDHVTTNRCVRNMCYDNKEECDGFEDLLKTYRRRMKDGSVSLSGPTNFGPAIRNAIARVKQVMSYHILLIITDGEVINRRDTEEAIVEASNYPLSIIIVGVGDGPFSELEKYDDELRQRRFDNVQCVNFTEICNSYRKSCPVQREVAFAIAALQEIPAQLNSIRKLNLL